MAFINGKKILSVVQTVGTSNVPVEGNPADTPTETLNTIKIDATTYEVGGGTKLYNHKIVVYIGSTTPPTAYGFFNIVSSNSNGYTTATLASYLNSIGYTGRISTGGIYAGFGYTRLNTIHQFMGLAAASSNNLLCYWGDANTQADLNNTTVYVNTDYVTEI